MKWFEIGRLSLVALAVASCSVQPPTPEPSPFPGVRDAIPKVEPRSKYGNPASYDVRGQRYYIMNDALGYVERGVASWYGPGFHGKRTSSGEPYDMYAMTAAHTTLPLPTYVYVTNLTNGRDAILRVNDRGPFEKNRLIDLSFSGAKKLGIDKPGTALVEIQALDPENAASWPPGAAVLVAAAQKAGDTTASTAETDVITAKPHPARSSNHQRTTPTIYLQVGAFSNLNNAENLRQRLQEEMVVNCAISSIQSEQQTLYRLRLGPLENVETADRLLEPLARLGINNPRIVVD